MKTKIICKNCKKEFIFSNKGKTFCSWDCYVKFSRQHLQIKTGDTLICENCGESYSFKSSVSGKRFCSTKCYLQFIGRGGNTFCKICNKEIKRRNRSTAAQLLTCSVKCLQKLRKIKYEKYHLKVNCLLCGKEFITKNKKQKYCSTKCRILSYKKTRNGKNNSNWKGGIKKENAVIRDSEEYSIWRTLVFKRDKYTCQKCDKRGGVLHAHHIKSFAKFKKLRLNLNNGITLCFDCHKRTHIEKGEVWNLTRIDNVVKEPKRK